MIINNLAFTSAARQEVDVEVAILAHAETKNPHEVAIILSQSDQVREGRAAVPDSRSWEEYVRQAKEYLRVIQDTANQRQKSETMKSPEVSR